MTRIYGGIPSYSQRAHGPEDAAYPELWDGLAFAWDAGLGNTGATARDVSGRGNHGAITGATWTAGQRGRCLNFNGSSDVVPFNLPKIGDYWTVLCVAASTVAGATYGAVWRPSNDVVINLGLYWHTDGTWQLYINDGFHETGVAADTTERAFAVVRSDGLNGTMFVDGQSKITGMQLPANVLGGAWRIGFDTFGSQYFNGHIAQFAVYNRALSTTSIRLLSRDPHALTRLRRIRWQPVAVAGPPAVGVPKQFMHYQRMRSA
ncbi:MAG: hypothetical protein PHU85_07235 [Phycisphaerae bacterium]|nr:hypothetical protein [Phycisphaerae bacterium]